MSTSPLNTGTQSGLDLCWPYTFWNHFILFSFMYLLCLFHIAYNIHEISLKCILWRFHICKQYNTVFTPLLLKDSFSFFLTPPFFFNQKIINATYFLFMRVKLSTGACHTKEGWVSTANNPQLKQGRTGASTISVGTLVGSILWRWLQLFCESCVQ